MESPECCREANPRKSLGRDSSLPHVSLSVFALFLYQTLGMIPASKSATILFGRSKRAKAPFAIPTAAILLRTKADVLRELEDMIANAPDENLKAYSNPYHSV